MRSIIGSFFEFLSSIVNLIGDWFGRHRLWDFTLSMFVGWTLISFVALKVYDKGKDSVDIPEPHPCASLEFGCTCYPNEGPN